MIASLGVIGVGAIAEAVVEGLQAGEHPVDVHLAPRSAAVAARLEHRYDRVHVWPDGQSVIEASEALILSVRPPQVESALADVHVPRDRVVISVVAGWSRSDLEALLPSRPTVVRAIPLPTVRARRGLTAVHPAFPLVEQLWEELGGCLVVDDEEAFSAVSAATGAISAHVAYVAEVSTWLGEHGVEPAAADRLTRSMFAGIGASLSVTGRSLADVLSSCETPGGLNEMLRSSWLTSRSLAELRTALDGVLEAAAGRG